MSKSQIDTVDVLADLLQSEQSNAFHFLTGADPYIHPALAELRRPLAQMSQNTLRREGELTDFLIELGSTPRPPAVSPEFQYFAYLAIDFLLPKLVEAKGQSINRYTAVLQLIGLSDPPLAQLLMSHLDQHREELAALESLASRASQLQPLSSAPTPAHVPARN